MIFNNDEPIYLQIVSMIEQKIKLKVWPEHYKLPDEIAYASQLGVSRGTLRTALDILYKKHLLVRIRGKGTFVAGEKIEQRLSHAQFSISEELERQSIDYVTKNIIISQINASKKMRSIFSLQEGEQVYCLERTRYIDNVPAAYLRNYVPQKLFPGLENEDFENQKLFDVMKNKYAHPVIWAQRYIGATGAGELETKKLNLKINEPILRISQTSFSNDDLIVEYSDIYLNSNIYEIPIITYED